jgi:hypothetical protein
LLFVSVAGIICGQESNWKDTWLLNNTCSDVLLRGTCIGVAV